MSRTGDSTPLLDETARLLELRAEMGRTADVYSRHWRVCWSRKAEVGCQRCLDDEATALTAAAAYLAAGGQING